MAIKLGDFVAHLKREGQYGQVAVTNDQATTDVLASINKRGTLIWGRADWQWGRELLKFALAPNQRQYAVAAVSGNYLDRLQELVPYDPTGTYLQGKPLREHTTWDFYSHVANPGSHGAAAGATPCNQGFPTDYYVVEMDANGNWQIIVDPVPVAAGFLGGYAKAVLYTYLLADVVANQPIQYFPNGVVLDALFSGCMIDVALCKGLPLAQAAPLEAEFEAKIARLVADQSAAATDYTPPTRRLPATVFRLRRRRRC